MTYITVCYSIVGALLLMMALGIILSVRMPVADRWSKRYFITKGLFIEKKSPLRKGRIKEGSPRQKRIKSDKT